MQRAGLNHDVTKFLDELSLPLRKEIEQLRTCILSANSGLTENIKWNGPNYCFDSKDRITMKVHPPKQVQLVFHRGAKSQDKPTSRLLADDKGLLVWKEHDRAVATFNSMADIERSKSALQQLVNDWIVATS